MKSLLKFFILFGLSFQIVSLTLHIDMQNEYHDGYNICDIDCNDQKHHSINHQCVKCLNKTDRMIIQELIQFSFNKYVIFIYSLKEKFDNSPKFFNLYSRPPPSIL